MRKFSLNMQIGRRVKLARESKKISQEQLALFVGRSPKMISAIERGIKMPSVNTLFAIRQQLDVTLDYLIGEGDD